jgi:hypothetical protein
MADTLVERVTGRPADVPAPITVNLVISDEALLGGSSTAATITGYGPIPAAIACRLVADAAGDKRSRAALRRLYAHPRTGQLVALESRSRCFPRGLADFIALRDQRCRTPYCDAPIRHRDHATPHGRGGRTHADNGLGLCEKCNYVKESGGWRVETGQRDGRRSAQFTTPTGACYHSTAPPLPGRPVVDISEVEAGIAVALDQLHAA